MSIKECPSELEEDPKGYSHQNSLVNTNVPVNHLQITSYNKQLSKKSAEIDAATEKIQKAHMNLMIQLNKPSFLHDIAEESPYDSKSKVSQAHFQFTDATNQNSAGSINNINNGMIPLSPNSFEQSDSSNSLYSKSSTRKEEEQQIPHHYNF